MDKIKVVGPHNLSDQELDILSAFALRSAYKKSRDKIFHLVDASSIILMQEVAHKIKSRSRLIGINFRNAAKLSSVDHIYGKKIPGLSVKDPLTLINVERNSKIGEFWGVPIWMVPSQTMNGFPPILVNSNRITPIKIFFKKDLKTSMNPKNVTVVHNTYFANISEVFETEMRSSMGAFQNLERYKRFVKALTDEIIIAENMKNGILPGQDRII